MTAASCKAAPGRPIKEESDSQLVDRNADDPTRLATDRSECDNPDAGMMTVAHPETGQYVPSGLKPISTPAFARSKDTDADRWSTEKWADMIMVPSEDIPEATRIKISESETHRVVSEALEATVIFHELSNIA